MIERPQSVVVAGARLFDEGRFFDAHEAWEEHWLVEVDPTRRLLLQGLIQIAAGFHKLLVVNAPESAARLLGRGLEKLERCGAQLDDANLAPFREGVRRCATALDEQRFDRSMLPECLPKRKP